MSVITSIMASFMIWIAAVTGIPVPAEMPALERASLEEMYCAAYEIEKQDCPASVVDKGLVPIALYDENRGVITIWDKTKLLSTKGFSMLIHELVHHMQAQANLMDTYACRGALEKVAYDAELRWLEEQGYDPWEKKREFTRMDKFTYLLITSCFDGL